MKESGAVFVAAGLLIAGCNDADFAENMVEMQAERNARRLIEQQREELPLPDPEVVEFISYSVEQLAPDDGFRVSLVDDLVLGEGRSDPEYQFVRFSGRRAALGNVAVDAAGRIVVLETRSSEVRVFDRDGDFEFSFGQPGEGPADFQAPYGIAVAGDRVHVFHRSYYSSVWSLEGEFRRDRETLRTLEAQEATRLLDAAEGTMATSRAESQRRSAARRFRTPLQVVGRDDGSLIMVFRAEPSERRGRIVTPFSRVVGRFDDGLEIDRLLEIPEWAAPSLALGPDGEMYIGMFGHLGTEHYVVALDAAGDPRFVIVTPWDPEVPPRADLRVDPRGHVFMFPNFRAPAEEPDSPVMVFDADGGLLGSGAINRRGLWRHWQVVDAEHVYGVRVDPVSEEWQVVRYRVELPEAPAR